MRSLISALIVAACPVRWKATEYELLRVLQPRPDGSPYDSLLHQVWGRWESVDLRLVCSLVRNFRRKLDDDAANPAYIFTVRQVGYRMPKPKVY